jgi:L-amino acid N-acyltransferase
VLVRHATPQDLAAINDIYNDVLTSSDAVYSEDLVTLDQRQQWFAARQAAGLPVLVAEVEGEVAGFGAYAEFRAWPGFRFTVEGSIHIALPFRRHGAGRLLLDALVEHARGAGKHVLIAGVDSGNAASLAFLKRYGFEEGGTLREVGYRQGRFLDLVFLQFRL